MDWIIHLDTDEMIHPAGAREYSLRQILLEVPGSVDMVVFPNYVSDMAYVLFVYETINICGCVLSVNSMALNN